VAVPKGLVVPIEDWWAGLLVAVGSVAVPSVVKFAIVKVALRGTEPKDRAAILKAVAELFSAGRWFSLPTRRR